MISLLIPVVVVIDDKVNLRGKQSMADGHESEGYKFKAKGGRRTEDNVSIITGRGL